MPFTAYLQGLKLICLMIVGSSPIPVTFSVLPLYPLMLIPSLTLTVQLYNDKIANINSALS